jgi:hypothetical protein
MNQKLKAIKNGLIKLHEEAGQDEQKLLEGWFPTLFNEKGPYLKACKLLGKTPVPPLEDRTDLDKVSSDAYDRLIICIRAKNMIDGKIWKQVYDGIEQHYWPYWSPDTSGFGFSRAFCASWDTDTVVGARLEYRTRELAEEGANEFKKYYNDYLTL